MQWARWRVTLSGVLRLFFGERTMSDATYRHEDIRAVPHGYKVRTMTRGSHRVRVAFPPGRRQAGSGVLISILHPMREGNPCRLANPMAELVLMGAANPARKRHDALWRQASKLLKGNPNPNRWDGARRILTGHKNRSESRRWDAMSESQRRSFLHGFSFQPETESHLVRSRWAQIDVHTKGLIRRAMSNNAGDRIDWNAEMVARLEESYRGLRKAGWSHSDALREALAHTTAGRGSIAEFKKRIKNPDAIEKAADLYEDFHGKSPSEVVELQEADTVRKTYTALGDLVDLTIETPDGKGARIEFTGDGVKVASAPGGKQLYLIGGAQSLDDQLDKFGADAGKDFVEIGRAMQITYRARKSMNDFRLVDYYHDLGEESGKPPLAYYDRLRQRIYFVGGSYHVEAPGIID